MGEFIKHIPCEKCKSKDNMAEYTDGYYCFGCGEKSTKENHTYFKNSNKLDKRPIIPPQTKDDAYPASFKRRFEREVLGERLYTYKVENGDIAFHIEKKIKDNGKKTFLPYCYYEFNDGTRRWINNLWPSNIPLFNIHNLKNRKTNKILIVEGEKSAIAAQHLFKSKYTCLSWCGGAQSNLGKTNWSTLDKTYLNEELEITLFPDNDTVGIEVMHKIAKILIENNYTTKIKWINPPKECSEGWDIADPVPAGVNIYQLVNDAEEYKKDEKVWNKNNIENYINENSPYTNEEEIEKIKNNCVFVGEINQIVNIKNGQRFRIENFNNFYKFLVKPRRGNLSDLLLRDPNFRRVDSFWYRPEEKLIKNFEGKSYINLYVPPVIKPKEGDVKPFLDLINYMFGKRDAYVVIHWLRHVVKYPGKKINWALLIISEERGIGKSTLVKILVRLLGKQNIAPSINYNSIVQNHSNVIVSNLLACIEEVSVSGGVKNKKHLSNNLKTYITDEWVRINEKALPERDYYNNCNFILFSNEEDCMYVSNSERRYWIKYLNVKPQGDKYWKWFHEEYLEKGGYEFILNYLLQLKESKILHFKGRAPITKDFEEMTSIVENPLHNYLTELFEVKQGPFRFEIVSVREIIVFINENSKTLKDLYVSEAEVKSWLKKNCIKWNNNEWSRQGEKTTSGNNEKTPRLWLLNRDGNEKFKHMSAIEIYDYKMKEHF